MKGLAMIYSISTLLERGYSNSKIANELGIDRKTVRKYKKRIENGNLEPIKIERKSELDEYRDKIETLVAQNFSSVLIHKELKSLGVKATYSTIKWYVRENFKSKEAFAPMLMPPGEEVQVDFGYVGIFDGKKTWVFCMTLSYSRYSFCILVRDQKVETFIKCHREAFEYFNGVSKSVKIDNLKAGVLKFDFYEPTFQSKYKEFLEHYGSSPIACKPRTPQHKGKVESMVGYVKNNFIKSLKTNSFNEAQDGLKIWLQDANNRIHGTLKKIPSELFKEETLLPLPERRYELFDVLYRKVNNYAHISYNYNFYSVPYEYVGERVTIVKNENILRVYSELNEISLHTIVEGKGKFSTKENHKMAYKREKSTLEIEEQMREIGESAGVFLELMKQKANKYYLRSCRGILKLRDTYGKEVIEKACERALKYGNISYGAIKTICESKSYELEEKSFGTTGGFSHNLALYDRMTNEHS